MSSSATSNRADPPAPLSEPGVDGARTAGGYTVPLECYRAAGAVTAILLLPALGLAARFYRPMGQALAARGIHAVLFEQRGHGASAVRAGRAHDYGFREWLTEDIPAALDWMRNQFPDAEVVPMGHSLGGHLAACYVGLNPSAAGRLILTACGTPWAAAFQGGRRRQVQALYWLIPLLGAVLGYFPGDRLGFGGREARRLMRDWRKMVPDNRYHADGIAADLDAAVAGYAGAVLCVRGDADSMAPEPATEAVLDKLARATIRREVLRSDPPDFRADHFRWAREPDPAADLIARWLREPIAERAES